MQKYMVNLAVFDKMYVHYMSKNMVGLEAITGCKVLFILLFRKCNKMKYDELYVILIRVKIITLL